MYIDILDILDISDIYIYIYMCLVCVCILKTLESDISYHLTFPGDWYNTLAPIFRNCKPFVGMCLFKTYVGGWTTSSRMHERVIKNIDWDAVAVLVT